MSTDPGTGSPNEPMGVDTDPAALGSTHLIGIGGAGMSAVARLLLAHGVSVSGSDAQESRGLAALRERGARISIGQAAENIADARTVVVSTAIRETNPELAAAREAGLRVLHRSQALGVAMHGSQVVAVAGTHGKTTTSSMAAVALQECGQEPSWAIGAHVADLGTNAHLGRGRWFVAEADESDGSFLSYAPTIAVVTNIEPDHLDHYGSEEAFFQAFEDFADTLRPGGTLVACQDDSGSRRLAEAVRRRGGSVVTYVRYGDRVNSPVIDKGEADFIVSFELLEAARWLSYLKPDGQIVTNTQQIDPMPVITGAAQYPENLVEKMKAAGAKVDALDCLKLAEEAGSSKAVNIVLMGRLSHYFDLPQEAWQKSLEAMVPAKFLELNKKAFELGKNA